MGFSRCMSLVLPRFMISGRREQRDIDEILDCSPILGRRHSISVPAAAHGGSLRPTPPYPTHQYYYPHLTEEPTSMDGYFFERESYQPVKRRKSICNGQEGEYTIQQPTQLSSNSVPHNLRRGSMPSFAVPQTSSRQQTYGRMGEYSVHSRLHHAYHGRGFEANAPLSSPLCQPNLSAADYQKQMLRYEQTHYTQNLDSTDNEAFLSELDGLELEMFVEEFSHGGLSPDGFAPQEGSLFLKTSTGRESYSPHSDSMSKDPSPPGPAPQYYFDEVSRHEDNFTSPHTFQGLQNPAHHPREEFSPGAFPSSQSSEPSPPHPSIAQFPLARTRVDYPKVVVTNTRAPEKEKRSKGLKWTNVTDSVTSKYSKPQTKTRTRKGRGQKSSANQPNDLSTTPPTTNTKKKGMCVCEQ